MRERDRDRATERQREAEMTCRHMDKMMDRQDRVWESNNLTWFIDQSISLHHGFLVAQIHIRAHLFNIHNPCIYCTLQSCQNPTFNLVSLRTIHVEWSLRPIKQFSAPARACKHTRTHTHTHTHTHNLALSLIHFHTNACTRACTHAHTHTHTQKEIPKPFLSF